VGGARGSVIFLHGRGATAEDILGIADELQFSDLAYLAPQAARQTWYPNSFLAPIANNEPWLSSALELVGSIVEKLGHAGVPTTRVVILGFSQGACLATEFVARNPERYGGLVAFTGGLIGPMGGLPAHSGNLFSRSRGSGPTRSMGTSQRISFGTKEYRSRSNFEAISRIRSYDQSG
jgi:phospholipase/carboxylesterase